MPQNEGTQQKLLGQQVLPNFCESTIICFKPGTDIGKSSLHRPPVYPLEKFLRGRKARSTFKAHIHILLLILSPSAKNKLKRETLHFTDNVRDEAAASSKHQLQFHICVWGRENFFQALEFRGFFSLLMSVTFLLHFQLSGNMDFLRFESITLVACIPIF